MTNQPQNKTQQAYELDHDFFDRFEGYEEYDFDAEVIKPKGYPKYGDVDRYFWRPELITDFEQIEIEGILELIEEVDYLYTQPNLPIMSRRMLYMLNSVGEFPHQVIPVSIKDNEIPIYNHKTGQPSGKVNNTEYVAVQILENSDVFDYEKSDYRIDKRVDVNNPDRVRRIRQAVFKEPLEGFPPLFRIPEDRLNLYVSPQARAALEEAGITGIRFIDLTLDNYLP